VERPVSDGFVVELFGASRDAVGATVEAGDTCLVPVGEKLRVMVVWMAVGGELALRAPGARGRTAVRMSRDVVKIR
jgi:hypothetical protein